MAIQYAPMIKQYAFYKELLYSTMNPFTQMLVEGHLIQLFLNDEHSKSQLVITQCASVLFSHSSATSY